MSSSRLARALGAFGVVLALAVGFFCIIYADVVETRAHPFLAAQVEPALAQLPWFKSTPQERANVRQALGDACRHCSTRPPLRFDPDNTPREVLVATRIYIGAVFNLFVAILCLLAVNTFFLSLATASMLSPSPDLPGTRPLLALTLLAQFGAIVVYFAFPSLFYNLVGAAHLDLGLSWGALLAAVTVASFIKRWHATSRATQANAAQQAVEADGRASS